MLAFLPFYNSLQEPTWKLERILSTKLFWSFSYMKPVGKALRFSKLKLSGVKIQYSDTPAIETIMWMIKYMKFPIFEMHHLVLSFSHSLNSQCPNSIPVWIFLFEWLCGHAGYHLYILLLKDTQLFSNVIKNKQQTTQVKHFISQKFGVTSQTIWSRWSIG